jgi:putative endonuclease
MRGKIGRWGEAQAAEYLKAQRYQVIAQNVRTEHGEIDIIARRGHTLVFVEVKTRTNRAFGHPENSVTAQKKAHLVQSAMAFLLDHPEWDPFDWRIDVIAVEKGTAGQVNFLHFENAVQG